MAAQNIRQRCSKIFRTVRSSAAQLGHLCPTSEEALASGALSRMSSVNIVLVQVWELSSTNLAFRSGRCQVRAGHQTDDHTLCTMQGSLTRPDLKREMKYLEKLLYKNKNQHRESQHFRRLREASLAWHTITMASAIMLQACPLRHAWGFLEHSGMYAVQGSGR